MFQKIKSFLFKNTSTKQTVAKNTIWLTISNFGGRLIKAIIVIYGARVLGTAGWGVFSYALTLAGFLTLFMDPGINSILMRDAAKASDEDRTEIFSTTLAIKIVLLAIGVAIVIFVAPSFSTLPGAAALLPIVALILAGDTLREFFSSFIRAMEKMQQEAGIFLLTNLGIVVFGFIFLHLSLSARSFGWAYVAGTALGAVTAMLVLRRYFKTFISHFSLARVLPILKSAWPFAIAGALGLLFTNTDILIISWMRSASEVGIYSAAIRIVQTLYLVPAILQFSTLPLLSRLAGKDNERFRGALERTLGLIFLASIPLSIGGIVLGTQLMTFLFGAAYAAGGLAFKLLMLTLLFDFAGGIVVAAIFAYDHQKSLIICSGLGGVTNVVLDLILIPHFGMTGSAVATVIAQIVANWYLWHEMKKINQFKVLPSLKKIITAGLVMGVAILCFFFLGVPVIVNILLGGIVYVLMLRLLREPLLIEMKKVITAPAVS